MATAGVITINAGAVNLLVAAFVLMLQCCAGADEPDLRNQVVERAHQECSPRSAAVGRPSKVQSFFWTSIMMCAWAS